MTLGHLHHIGDLTFGPTPIAMVHISRGHIPRPWPPYDASEMTVSASECAPPRTGELLRSPLLLPLSLKMPPFWGVVSARGSVDDEHMKQLNESLNIENDAATLWAK